MFKNYLKIAVRNLIRHKAHSFINISGLAIGLACCILILLYVQYELSYDTFHEKADQIFRVVKQSPGHFYRGTDHCALTPGPLAPALANEYPEVVTATRIHRSRNVLLSYKDRRFYEDGFYWGDVHIFDIFTFPLIRGNLETALEAPYSIILSENVAKKYFGDEDPLGKVLTYKNKHEFKITGIMKNVPEKSHLKFDFLASFITLIEIRGRYVETSWGQSSYYTYILLQKEYPPMELENKLPAFIEKYWGDVYRSWKTPPARHYLQPLTRIHLHSHLNFEIEPNSDIKTIYLFSALAFAILLIACMNYTNLSTARSATRAKEVGMRKVVGARRWQLIKQFIGESVLLSFIALLLATVLVELFLSTFNSLIARNIEFNYLYNLKYLAGFIGIGLFVGVISGSYPAFFISSFLPVTVLKGPLKSGSKGSVLRNIMVVVQFAASIVLIIGTVTMYRQIEYIRNKKLGFNREQVVVMPLRGGEIGTNYEPIKNELLQHPNILGVTASAGLPNDIGERRGDITWEGKAEDEEMPVYRIMVDHDFIDVFEIELAEGRNFSKEFATDDQAYILNETAVRNIGWETSIGKEFGFRNKMGTVIGVVKDFHFSSLHLEIRPLFLSSEKWGYSYLSVKISTNNIPGTLHFLKEKWQKFSQEHPFEYFFLDDHFEKMYRSETRLAKIFSYFTFLAVLIACLGLFGLASFATEQRTKEIGIRKVLGASISGIVLLLSKEFTKLVLVSNLIAWPVAYWAMNRWLQDFAYPIHIGVGTFLLAGVLALVIALLTVSFQAIKAALANPVETLRYE